MSTTPNDAISDHIKPETLKIVPIGTLITIILTLILLSTDRLDHSNFFNPSSFPGALLIAILVTSFLTTLSLFKKTEHLKIFLIFCFAACALATTVYFFSTIIIIVTKQPRAEQDSFASFILTATGLAITLLTVLGSIMFYRNSNEIDKVEEKLSEVQRYIKVCLLNLSSTAEITLSHIIVETSTQIPIRSLQTLEHIVNIFDDFKSKNNALFKENHPAIMKIYFMKAIYSYSIAYDNQGYIEAKNFLNKSIDLKNTSRKFSDFELTILHRLAIIDRQLGNYQDALRTLNFMYFEARRLGMVSIVHNSLIGISAALYKLWANKDGGSETTNLISHYVNPIIYTLPGEKPDKESLLKIAFFLLKNVYKDNNFNTMAGGYIVKIGFETLRSKFSCTDAEKEIIISASQRTIAQLEHAGGGNLNLEANFAYVRSLCAVLLTDYAKANQLIQDSIHSANLFGTMYPRRLIYSDAQEKFVRADVFCGDTDPVHQKIRECLETGPVTKSV